jgi:membrane-associated phospholipid phosphatase
VKDQPRTGPFDIVDKSTLAYNAVVFLLVLLFHSRVPRWYLHVFLNTGTIGVVLLLVFFVGDRASLAARLLRNLYPIALFGFLYVQTGSINHLVFPGFLDASFARLEETIFGFQPAEVFVRNFPQKWLAECMYFAYWTYYLQFPGLGLFLYLRRTKTEFADYMLSLCATMYVCFLIYIFLPVRDPSFAFGYAPGSGPFTWMMTWIYRHAEIPGAAFPSSHVAIAAVVLYYTWRYARAALWVVGPLAVSLMVATVYCRYHYAVDVLAGWLTATVVILLCRRINPDLHRKPKML